MIVRIFSKGRTTENQEIKKKYKEHEKNVTLQHFVSSQYINEVTY